MKLLIITPTEKFLDCEVSHVKAPGTEGYFGVLENHTPFLTTLKDGDVTATLHNNKEETFHITGGLADIKDNTVKILAESVSKA